MNFSTHSVFEGCSFQVHEKTNPDDILALDMVKSIWPVRTISAPRPKVVAVGGSAGTPTWTSHARTGVLDLHKMGFLGEGVVIGVVCIMPGRSLYRALTLHRSIRALTIHTLHSGIRCLGDMILSEIVSLCDSIFLCVILTVV